MVCIRGNEVFHNNNNKCIYIVIYNEKRTCILTRSSDQMADSISYKIF